MQNTTTDGRDKRILGYARMIRDEARVRLHLGNMDLKGVWDGLRPRIKDAEDKLRWAATKASKALHRLLDARTQHRPESMGSPQSRQ